jgi:radical SAM protein with 4Fe4S-binding SPASM domain
VADQLKLKTLSMNMVIRTGQALGDRDIGVSYTEVAAVLPGLLDVARDAGIKLVWYSPIPYCIFNPVLHGLGAKSCACVDGILSVDPSGQVLPCSSFQDGIGSLLEQSFDSLYNNKLARYWKNKKFTPPVCQDCPDVDVCGGGCPLYWDAAGSFDELPRARAGDHRRRMRWERRRKKSRTFGVPAPRGN